MPLREVLNAFEQRGPMSLTQLAQRLDVDCNTLEGMIQFWVNKGKLREVGSQDCAACGVRHGCPLLVTLPRRYELVTDDQSAADETLPCRGKC